MDAQLASAVHLTDPETHQTIILDPGTCPEPRLAALVTNPSAWVDGKLPTGDGPDDASGDDSDNSADGDPQTVPADQKTAAKKAATSRSRGRNAAGEGASGE